MVKFTYNENPIPCSRPRSYNGRMLISKRYRQYKKDLATVLASQRFTPIDKDAPVKLSAWFYRKDRIHVDLDNLEKALSDALMDSGILPDDSQIVESHTFKGYDKENPRTEFCLEVASS